MLTETEGEKTDTTTEEEGRLTDLVIPDADKVEDKPETVVETDEKSDEQADLTQEQLDQLIKNPKVLEAVLGSQPAQDAIDKWIEDVLTETKTTEIKKKEDESQRATLDEALKKATEDGDYSDLGRLAADTIQTQRSREAALKQYAPAIQEAQLAALDEALTATFGPEIEALSEDEYKSLNRGNFGTDGEFLRAVIGKLGDKRLELARSDVSEVERRAKAAEDAARGRADGDIMLGGGATEQPSDSGASIGDLMRAAMDEALGESE